MTTREQFLIQMDRLKDTFGERHFPNQRTAMIWDMISELEYQILISIVDSFIKRSKYAPLPIDFSEALKEYEPKQKRYSLGELQPKEIAKCWDCADSGFIRLERLEKFDKWARWHSGSAPCHCHRGKQLIDAGKRMKRPIDFGPQFNNSWLSSYKIINEYEELSGVISNDFIINKNNLDKIIKKSNENKGILEVT